MSMAGVAGDRSNEIIYVYELPYTERRFLCKLLDINNQWERLGGDFMKFTVLELQDIRRVEKCGESPTDRLLQIWSQQNHKIIKLYQLLYKMKHYQAMTVLLPFVPPKYHALAFRGEHTMTMPHNWTSSSALHADASSQTKRESNPVDKGPLNHQQHLTEPNRTSQTVVVGPVHVPEGAVSLRNMKSKASSKSKDEFSINLCQDQDGHKGPKMLSKVSGSLLVPMGGKAAQGHVPALQATPEVAVSSTEEEHTKKKLNVSDGESGALDNNTIVSAAGTTVQLVKPDFAEEYREKARAKELEFMAARDENPNEISASDNITADSFHQMTDPQTQVMQPGSLRPQKSQDVDTDINHQQRNRRQSNPSNASIGSDYSVPSIPYKELEEATNSWSRDQRLGSGGFGTVYFGLWKKTQVAIKKIDPHGETVLGMPLHITQALDELRLLQSYRHDNILQVYGYSADLEKPHCLVYQFMSNGSLEDRLQCRKIPILDVLGIRPSQMQTVPLNWRQRCHIAHGTAHALQYLHTVKEKPLIHGDVKSANILLDQNLDPKLGDFGLAREGPESKYTSLKVSRVHGTKPYVPEEYLREHKLSARVDTYSYGVVLFELCTGLRAYDKDRPKQLLKDHVLEADDKEKLRDRKAGNEDREVFHIICKIGTECVRRTPRDRPSMTRVFQELESLDKSLKEQDRMGDAQIGGSTSGTSSLQNPLLLPYLRDTGASLPSPSVSPSTVPSLSPHLYPGSVPIPNYTLSQCPPQFHASPSHPHSPRVHSPVPHSYYPPVTITQHPSSVHPQYLNSPPSVFPAVSPIPLNFSGLPLGSSGRFCNPSTANNLYWRQSPAAGVSIGGYVAPGLGHGMYNPPNMIIPHISISPASGSRVDKKSPPGCNEAIAEGQHDLPDILDLSISKSDIIQEGSGRSNEPSVEADQNSSPVLRAKDQDSPPNIGVQHSNSIGIPLLTELGMKEHSSEIYEQCVSAKGKELPSP